MNWLVSLFVHFPVRYLVLRYRLGESFLFLWEWYLAKLVNKNSWKRRVVSYCIHCYSVLRVVRCVKDQGRSRKRWVEWALQLELMALRWADGDISLQWLLRGLARQRRALVRCVIVGRGALTGSCSLRVVCGGGGGVRFRVVVSR